MTLSITTFGNVWSVGNPGFVSLIVLVALFDACLFGFLASNLPLALTLLSQICHRVTASINSANHKE